MYKQQIDLLESNEKELAIKNASNLKVIRLLTEKCNNQSELIERMEEKLEEMRLNETNNEDVITELEEKLLVIEASSDFSLCRSNFHFFYLLL